MADVCIDCGIFLIVGRGSIGRRHENILRSLGHEVVTVDPDPATGADYRNLVSFPRYPFLTWDGVLLCTPPDVRRVNLPFAAAVFVEKPLGDYPDEGPPVQVGFCYRFSPTLTDFVEIVKKHTIYHLSVVGGQHLQRWHKQDYRTRRYWGATLDSLPHSLYIARWILGDLSLAGGVASKLSGLEIDVDDVSAMLLQNDEGVPVFLLADYVRDPRVFYIEAVTSGGWHRWEFSTKDVEYMYRRQMLTFVALCCGEDVARPTLEDGRAVQRILDAVGSTDDGD